MRNWIETHPFVVLAALFSGVVLVPLGVGLLFAGFHVVGLLVTVVGVVMRPSTSWWVRNHGHTDSN